MQTGDQASLEFTVTEEDTASALGSGDLPVLGTPRLLAWAEAATCAAVQEGLADGQTSVGTRVQVDHVGASPVGATLRVTASVTHLDGRLVRFEVVAEHTADHKVVVDRERFLSRLGT